MSGLVYRQVHKKHVDELLQPASMVFNPFVTGGQEGKRHRVLSAYDGDQISAKDAHRHFTRELGLTSAGVLAVSVQECEDRGIRVDYDGLGFPAHVSLHFPRLSRRATGLLADELFELAMARGWQHGPFVGDAAE